MSSREARPAWWDREYEAKRPERPEWAELMNPMSMQELLDAVRRIEPGKAAGPDRLSADMMKYLFWGGGGTGRAQPDIVWNRESRQWEDAATLKPNAAMEVILLLCNASVALEVVTPSMQLGEIVYLPKLTAAGTATTDVEDMRPITLLPELGKLANRVFAARMTETLLRHPGLVDESQRGFLKDGSTMQCVNVALDVLEDYHERGGAKSLFVLSYDLTKAYDSVQEYTLRAALTRAGVPEGFVSYVTSMLRAARSRVRTKHGLTEGFDIKTSVRQGDPLSPILFILLADLLHRGLKANPLYEGASDGYRFTDERELVISSCGYADDFIIFSESAEGIERMHHWVREFCGSHELEINAKKTVFITSGCHAHEIPILTNVAGDALIEPKEDTFEFRYLGVWLRVRRGQKAWDRQRRVSADAVKIMRAKIVSNRLDLAMGVHVVNTVLIPQLEMAGRVVNFAEGDLTGWNRDVIRSILTASGGQDAGSVCRVAFNHVTGLIHPYDAIRGAMIMDLGGRLAAERRPDGKTLWARLRAAAGSDKSKSAILAQLSTQDRNRVPMNNRVLMAFAMMRELEIEASHNAVPWWTGGVRYVQRKDWRHLVWDPMVSRFALTRTEEKLDIDAFTDGSTIPGAKKPSGFGFVLKCALSQQTLVRVGGPCRASGNNYLAECLALLGATQTAPEQAKLTLYTDSAAAIWAIRGYNKLSGTKRLRLGARPVLGALARLLQARSGETRVVHVRSHTDGSDYWSQGNAEADALANEGRGSAEEADLNWLTDGEESVVFYSEDRHVIGDLRAEVKRRIGAQRFAEWQHMKHQGRVARVAGPRILAHCKEIRRMARATQAPEMLLFLLLAVCEWLPARGRDSHTAPTFESKTCIWCAQQVVDDSRHALNCMAGHSAAARRWGEVQRLLKGLPKDVLRRPTAVWDAPLILAARAAEHDSHGRLDGELCLALARQYLVTTRGRGNAMAFLAQIGSLLSEFACGCLDVRQACALDDCHAPAASFQDIFRRECHLNMELFADALHRNPAFPRWASARVADKTHFGAAGNAFDLNWAGVMAWVFPPDGAWTWARLVENLGNVTKTELPTRLVLLMETGRVAETIQQYSEASVLCSFAAGVMPIVDPHGFQARDSGPRSLFHPTGLTVVLFENQEARDRSPVDYPALARALRRWGDTNGVEGRIETGRGLVATRNILNRWWLHARPHRGQKEGQLNWFDELGADEPRAIALVRHPTEATQKRLDEIAGFDKYLGALGLLPPALTGLIGGDEKQPDKEQRERLQRKRAEISQAVFRGTFHLWMERRRRATAWKFRAKLGSEIKRARRVGKRKAKRKQSSLAVVGGVRRSKRVTRRPATYDERDD